MRKFALPGLFLLFTSLSLSWAQELLLNPDEKLSQDKTSCWSPLFQASWDRLNQEHGGPSRDHDNAMIEKLDAFQWNEKKVMPKGRYAVFAGPDTQAFIDKTNRALGEKFGPDAKIQRLVPGDGSKICIVGHLEAAMDFRFPFFESKTKGLAFQVGEEKAEVAFFGTVGEASGRYKSTVKVLANGLEEPLCIEVVNPELKQSVVLYLPEMSVEETFSEVFDRVNTLINAEAGRGYNGALDDPYLHEGDSLKIPYVKFSLDSDVTEQLSSVRTTAKGERWRISQASQLIQFELDEKGARVKSHVEIADEPFGEPPKPKPRKFIFDRPFFVMMWREDAVHPYFACYVNDLAVLRKFGAKSK